MKTYRCSNCGYKTKKEIVPESCNYCSKKDCMNEIESAERIVEEI
jgi:rubredoxin